MPHRQARARILGELGELRAEVDPQRPSGRLLRQAGMDASYVDLTDPTHLEFDYLRWMRIVIRAAGARHVLHIGGGACALARALCAEDATGRHAVCEVDADVLTLARAHLGLRRAPGLRVHHVDGRAFLESQRDASWDAIVIDAFVGARVPAHLISADALRHAARVAPMTLANVVDSRAGRELRAVTEAMGTAYPRAWTAGRSPGNTLVVGCADAAHPDLQRVRTRLAADASPAAVQA